MSPTRTASIGRKADLPTFTRYNLPILTLALLIASTLSLKKTPKALLFGWIMSMNFFQTKDGVFTLCAMTSGIRRNWIQAVMKNVQTSVAPDVTW